MIGGNLMAGDVIVPVLFLVFGLVLLVTPEMTRQRSAEVNKTVVLLQEQCYQSELNVTKLEELTAAFVASMNRSDLNLHVKFLPKSVVCDNSSHALSPMLSALNEATTATLIASFDSDLCEAAVLMAAVRQKQLVTWSCPQIEINNNNNNYWGIGPSLGLTTEALVQVVKQFRWKSAAILTVDAGFWPTLAHSLDVGLRQEGLIVRHHIVVKQSLSSWQQLRDALRPLQLTPCRVMFTQTTKPEPEDWITTLLKQLECPICWETCIPPIYMCTKGHNLCSACRGRLTECGLCRSKISDGQNWFAQEISSKLVVIPCRNAKQGCDAMVKLCDVTEHENGCSFRALHQCYVNYYVYPDGLQFCNWKGPGAALVNHMRDAHPFYLSSGETTELSCRVSPLVMCLLPNIMLISAHGKLFWYEVFWSPEDLAIAVVHYVGDEREAAMFSFEIALESSDGRNKLKFRHMVDVKRPWPHRPGCLQLTLQMMEIYQKNGVVTFQAQIFRNIDKHERYR